MFFPFDEETFEHWVARHEGFLNETHKALGDEIPDNPDGLRRFANRINARHGNLRLMFAIAKGYLHRARAERITRGKAITALEREVQLDAACAKEESMRDALEGFAEAVKGTVMLCQSEMKEGREDRNRSGVQEG